MTQMTHVILITQIKADLWVVHLQYQDAPGYLLVSLTVAGVDLSG